jgi:hypothetical protein
MPFIAADRLRKLAARASRFTYGPVIKYFRDRNYRSRRANPTRAASATSVR